MRQLMQQQQQHVRPLKPKETVDRMAFAQLLADALFAASAVLGPRARRDQWWAVMSPQQTVGSSFNAPEMLSA